MKFFLSFFNVIDFSAKVLNILYAEFAGSYYAFMKNKLEQENVRINQNASKRFPYVSLDMKIRKERFLASRRFK
jgi:predicted transcriptional regulator